MQVPVPALAGCLHRLRLSPLCADACLLLQVPSQGAYGSSGNNGRAGDKFRQGMNPTSSSGYNDGYKGVPVVVSAKPSHAHTFIHTHTHTPAVYTAFQHGLNLMSAASLHRQGVCTPHSACADHTLA